MQLNLEMKVIYCFFTFVLMFKLTSAQIVFTVTKNDPPCNSGLPGSVVVTVNQINPPYTYQWSNGQTEPVTDLAIGEYTLTITDGLLNDSTITIKINDCSVFPEIVFTPNGDGYNDTWNITNIEYFPNAKVLVFNRWGQKVFENKGLYQPWDGRDLLGVLLPDASYFFILFENKDDKKSLIKGNVSILK